jgi:hypothetical protein
MSLPVVNSVSCAIVASGGEHSDAMLARFREYIIHRRDGLSGPGRFGRAPG